MRKVEVLRGNELIHRVAVVYLREHYHSVHLYMPSCMNAVHHGVPRRILYADRMITFRAV